MSVEMETSILNQYEEDFSDVFQPQENTVERLGDVLFDLVNNDQPIDIIDFILHDEQQDTQVLHELEDNAAKHQQSIDSRQHSHIIDDNDKGTTESSPNLSNRECLSTTPPVEHLLQAHYAETFYQTLVDIVPVIGSPVEEQSTVNAKKENPFTIVNDTEISNSITTSIEICKSTGRTRKRKSNIKKTNKITKRRRIDNTLTKTKREEQEDCVDIETVSDEVPVLEAGDVTSLLEQFEATENMMLPVTSRVKKNPKTRAKSSGRPRGRPPKYPKCQDALKKTTSRCNNVRVTDKDLLPQVVIERLKIVTPVQGHKTGIVAIPDVPKIQHPKNSSCDINQIQDDKSTLSSNNSPKVINSPMTNLKNSSNNATQNKMKKSFFSVYHDHDYCSNSNFITNNISNKKLIKCKSKIQRTTDKDFVKTNDTIKYNPDSNLKRNTDLISTTVNDTCNIPSTSTALSERTNSLLRNNQNNGCAKESPLRQIQTNNLPITKNVPKVPNKATNIFPVREMKINSALAKSILKSRQDLKLKKMQMPVYPVQQMVSILKNPPNKLQLPTTNNLKESIITTTDSTNRIIQNIVIQNTDDIQPQQIKQPVRRRLKLEEYRNRKRKYNGGNVTTTSKRYELVPIYNVFTSTEPFTDNFGKQTLYQQELLLDTKCKLDTEEENKSKPTTRDIGTQTYSKNCGSSNFLVSNENKYVLKINNESNSSRSRSRSRSTSRIEKNKKDSSIVERNTENRNVEISLQNKPRDKSRERTKSRESRSKTRSMSRSRSIARSKESTSDSSKRRSRSSNDSKTRPESSSQNRSRSKRRERSRSRSRCRSRSRKYSPNRQRKRRHSSVSSNSNSSYSSRSKYRRSRSRSRSRSYQSRSRSSSQHYISHSRLSSHSNSERNRWSNRYSGHERSYERYKRQTPYNHPDRDWKRSPQHYHHRRDNWHHEEKQKQVDERRVIYVGGIDKNTPKTDLYERFGKFGSVVDVSIHPRNNDNYGFITFLHRRDAYKALEHGNDNSDLPRYDLSFGGRRAFCQVKYEDLDGMANNSSFDTGLSPANDEGVFDYLLREAKKRLD